MLHRTSFVSSIPVTPVQRHYLLHSAAPVGTTALPSRTRTCAPLQTPALSRTAYPVRALCAAAGDRDDGVRINKCFRSFASRRAADAYVAAGRVTVNGATVTSGARVHSGDQVSLDGSPIEWEVLNVSPRTDDFVYYKYWKPFGVVCTTDTRIPDNFISVNFSNIHTRVFPVGRLDRASSGLLLITSDGRLPARLLGHRSQCSKTYIVTPDLMVSDDDLHALCTGVHITTLAQRDNAGARKPLSAPTLPCDVRRAAPSSRKLYFTLHEGRNRQIRKMLGALGYTTRAIHRVDFMGIGLDGLRGEGDYKALDNREMDLIMDKISD